MRRRGVVGAEAEDVWQAKGGGGPSFPWERYSWGRRMVVGAWEWGTGEIGILSLFCRVVGKTGSAAGRRQLQWCCHCRCHMGGCSCGGGGGGYCCSSSSCRSRLAGTCSCLQRACLSWVRAVGRWKARPASAAECHSEVSAPTEAGPSCFGKPGSALAPAGSLMSTLAAQAREPLTREAQPPAMRTIACEG